VRARAAIAVAVKVPEGCLAVDRVAIRVVRQPVKAALRAAVFSVPAKVARAALRERARVADC